MLSLSCCLQENAGHPMPYMEERIPVIKNPHFWRTNNFSNMMLGFITVPAVCQLLDTKNTSANRIGSPTCLPNLVQKKATKCLITSIKRVSLLSKVSLSTSSTRHPGPVCCRGRRRPLVAWRLSGPQQLEAEPCCSSPPPREDLNRNEKSQTM